MEGRLTKDDGILWIDSSPVAVDNDLLLGTLAAVVGTPPGNGHTWSTRKSVCQFNIVGECLPSLPPRKGMPWPGCGLLN
jgi:hypothetical protein